MEKIKLIDDHYYKVTKNNLYNYFYKLHTNGMQMSFDMLKYKMIQDTNKRPILFRVICNDNDAILNGDDDYPLDFMSNIIINDTPKKEIIKNVRDVISVYLQEITDNTSFFKSKSKNIYILKNDTYHIDFECLNGLSISYLEGDMILDLYQQVSMEECITAISDMINDSINNF